MSILILYIKLLAKILSNRPNSILETMIHKGFIPSRQTGDNICRATLIAHMAQTAASLSVSSPLTYRRHLIHYLGLLLPLSYTDGYSERVS